MFNRSRLLDGAELTAHVDKGALVLQQIRTEANGFGAATWGNSMPLAEARSLRDFLNSQNLEG